MMLRRLGLWLLLAVLTLGPVAVLIVYAVSRRWFFPALLPAEWSLTTLHQHLNDARVQRALGQSALVATLVSGLALLVGYPAARALELGRLRARNAIYALLFLPTVVPAVATGIGLNSLFLRLGLAGTLPGVALVHLVPVLPYAVFTLGGVFASYDSGFELQARTLGAGRWHTWRRVTLPLLLPGIAVTLLLAFLISWSQYTLTLLVGAGRVQTLPIVLFAALSGGQNDDIAALALVFVAPLLVLIALAARTLAAGAHSGELVVA